MERAKSKGKNQIDNQINEKKNTKYILKEIFFSKNKIKKILLFFNIFFLILIFLISYKKFLTYFILFLITLINLIFSLAKRYFKFYLSKYLLGIELVLFSTILISYLYGSNLGSIMGAFLMIINYISEHRFSKFFIITIPLYYLIGFTAFYFRNYNIKFVGITYAILYNFITNILSRKLEPNLKSLFIFNIMNIIFNIILFLSFSEFFLYFLKNFN